MSPARLPNAGWDACATTEYRSFGAGVCAHTPLPSSTLISDIRIIEGLGNPPVDHRDIAVVDGEITAIGPAGYVKAPDDALTIDGRGLTAIFVSMLVLAIKRNDR